MLERHENHVKRSEGQKMLPFPTSDDISISSAFMLGIGFVFFITCRMALRKVLKQALQRGCGGEGSKPCKWVEVFIDKPEQESLLGLVGLHNGEPLEKLATRIATELFLEPPTALRLYTSRWPPEPRLLIPLFPSQQEPRSVPAACKLCRCCFERYASKRRVGEMDACTLLGDGCRVVVVRVCDKDREVPEEVEDAANAPFEDGLVVPGSMERPMEREMHAACGDGGIGRDGIAAQGSEPPPFRCKDWNGGIRGGVVRGGGGRRRGRAGGALVPVVPLTASANSQRPQIHPEQRQLLGSPEGLQVKDACGSVPTVVELPHVSYRGDQQGVHTAVPV